MGSSDGDMGPGVVFKTGLNGLGWCLELKSKDSWKRWRPIDSNITNDRKCLEVKQYERLYEERTCNICGNKLRNKRRMNSHMKQ